MAERKRGRDNDQEEEIGMEGVSAYKHFRRLNSEEEEELIHMLEDVEEEPNVADEDIVSAVMRSLEEEIISSCRCTETIPSAEPENRPCDVEESRNEMSYLLIASDDELGIPPSPFVKDSPVYEACAYSSAADEACTEVAGIPWYKNESLVDALWHFEDYNSNWLERVGDEYILFEEERDLVV